MLPSSSFERNDDECFFQYVLNMDRRGGVAGDEDAEAGSFIEESEEHEPAVETVSPSDAGAAFTSQGETGEGIIIIVMGGDAMVWDAMVQSKLSY